LNGDLSIWGREVLEKYKHLLPPKKQDRVNENLRIMDSYNTYENDIAQVTFYFQSPTVLAFGRGARLTVLEFVGQIGGLMGLCIGFSFVSVVEVVYLFLIKPIMTRCNLCKQNSGSQQSFIK
jgi:acid-sensing ion channel, other